MTTISVRTLIDTVQARLEAAVSNANAFVTEATDAPLIPNSDGRPAPYYVLHPGIGAIADELDLGDTIDAIDWTIQVTCVAGYTTDLAALVDRVHAALYRWEMAVAGLVCGPFRPPPGYQSQILLDRQTVPHRPYLPLQYVAPITAA